MEKEQTITNLFLSYENVFDSIEFISSLCVHCINLIYINIMGNIENYMCAIIRLHKNKGCNMHWKTCKI